MYQVTKTIAFCYGHRLLNYQGKCKYLHGHNGVAEITLERKKLDHRGMVADFTDVKNMVGGFINEKLDHKLLLCKRDPMIPLLKKSGEPHFLMEENPTAENIAKVIYDFSLETNLPVISVKLWETETSFAVYKGKK